MEGHLSGFGLFALPLADKRKKDHSQILGKQPVALTSTSNTPGTRHPLP